MSALCKSDVISTIIRAIELHRNLFADFATTRVRRLKVLTLQIRIFAPTQYRRRAVAMQPMIFWEIVGLTIRPMHVVPA